MTILETFADLCARVSVMTDEELDEVQYSLGKGLIPAMEARRWALADLENLGHGASLDELA